MRSLFSNLNDGTVCMSAFHRAILFLHIAVMAASCVRSPSPDVIQLATEWSGSAASEATLASEAALGQKHIFGGLSEQESCADPLSRSVARISFFPEAGSADTAIACTGSVISSHAVLTAAHCGGTTTYSGRGEFIVQCGCSEDTTRTTLFEAMRSDSQTAAQGRGDVALLRFEGGLPGSCEPLLLADVRGVGTGTNTGVAGEPVALAGFGSQPNGVAPGRLSLAQAKLRSESHSSFHGALGLLTNLLALDQVTDPAPMGTCTGDSGGPYLQRAADGRAVQVGVHFSFDQAASAGAGTTPLDGTCPEGVIMVGHPIAEVRRWLDSLRVPYLRGLAASPADQGEPANGDPNAAAMPSPGGTQSCELRAFTETGSLDSIWSLGRSPSAEACAHQCSVAAGAFLALSPQNRCFWGGEAVSEALVSPPELSLCQQNSSSELLRLRFFGSAAPCQVELQRGSCGAQPPSFPAFSGSAQHVVCAEQGVAAQAHTSCVWIHDSSSGTLSWRVSDDAPTQESCLQFCGQQDLGSADTLGEEHCVFRMRSLSN